MLNFRTAILAFLVASASAIPTPQASETPESTTSVEVASFEQTVDCGCWNMCTLQQLATPSIICSQECGKLHLKDLIQLKNKIDIMPIFAAVKLEPI